MYRTIYPEAPGLHHSWYNKNHLSRKRTLEKCQCMRFQYRYHLGWIKKMFGLFIILISLTGLAWNEKKAVEISRSFHEGLRSVVVLSSPDEILPENDEELIHVSGYLSIAEPLQDPPYGVSISAVKLKRRVQMYQWVEEKISETDEFSNHQTSYPYHYTMAWKDKLLDSSKYAIGHPEHVNPTEWPIASEVRTNPLVRLGKFILGPELKEKFTQFIQFTSGERPDNQDIKMHMGLYYQYGDIWSPAIGDVRIQFSFAGPADSFISVIARQKGGELRPFYTDSGSQIAFLHEGKKSHMEIFTQEHSSVTLFSWIFRGAIWVLTIIGSSMASKVITLMNRRNPVVQNLMSVGPTKFSFIAASFLCLSTMGCMWFYHKPLFGFLLITFACSLFLYYALIGSNRSPNRNSLPHYSQLY